MDDADLLIIDTSVILKWFFFEENRDNALRIRDDFLRKNVRLGMPAHCLFEAGNIVGLKLPEEALLVISEIKMMSIYEYPLTLEVSKKSLDIMKKFPKTSFYDAVYHALAIENNGTFVTADKKYHDATKSLKHIRLLEKF